MKSADSACGFTLIQLLTALLILSLLSLMSYRGLGAVLDARAHVRQETNKWQRVAAFSARFGQDMQLMAPFAMRIASGSAPVFLGRSETAAAPRIEFNCLGDERDLERMITVFTRTVDIVQAPDMRRLMRTVFPVRFDA